MRIVRNKSGNQTATEAKRSWKIMVVDDEPGVHALTTLNLSDLTFANRPVQLLSAYSAAEALKVLEQHPDIAVALVDVVMETTDAGLNLVDHIRNNLHNKNIRLIIRTGQPGSAPERLVIDRYDIDDYKEKTELTAQKLYTVVRSALKSYQDLCSIECTNRGLAQILHAAPELYRIRSLQAFFQGVLEQIIALLKIGEHHLNGNGIFQPRVMIVTREKRFTGRWLFRCGTHPFLEDDAHTETIIQECRQAITTANPPSPGSLLLSLTMASQVVGFFFLQNAETLTDHDRQFLNLLSNQCVSALENHWLYDDLDEANARLRGLNAQLAEANEQTVFMLAVASEFKDQETGNHINRIVNFTEQISLHMAIQPDSAKRYGRASMLHDLGKMGIPDAILQKPGKLTEEEFQIIRDHPRMGKEILSKSEWFDLAREIAFCHHEKFDGTGYPQGLKGEEIPLPARIVAVADVFDALTSRRPYKEAWTVEDAVEEIKRGRGTHFDPRVVDAFLMLYQEGVLQRITSLYA